MVLRISTCMRGWGHDYSNSPTPLFQLADSGETQLRFTAVEVSVAVSYSHSIVIRKAFNVSFVKL